MTFSFNEELIRFRNRSRGDRSGGDLQIMRDSKKKNKEGKIWRTGK